MSLIWIIIGALSLRLSEGLWDSLLWHITGTPNLAAYVATLPVALLCLRCTSPQCSRVQQVEACLQHAERCAAHSLTAALTLREYMVAGAPSYCAQVAVR